jgi:talin
MVNSLNSPNDQVNIDAQAVAANLKGLLDAAKLAAIGTDDQALLEAGRRVAQAVAQMLAASATLSNSPDDLAAKRALQESIEALKGATAYVKGAVQNLLVDSPSEQLLLASAKRVADAVQKLAGNVNSAAQRLEPDSTDQQRLLAVAKASALAGRDVYQTAKIVAPISVMPDAQQQLLNAGKRAFDEAQLLANAANAANLPESEMPKIAAAAKLVGDAMAQLVNSIGCVESAASSEVIVLLVFLLCFVHLLVKRWSV